MKIVQPGEREVSFNTESCTVHEHPYETGAYLNTADITLRGRYPENTHDDKQMWVRNTAVDALINVTKGRGEVLRPGEPAEPVGAESSVSIRRGEWYALSGHMALKYVSAPPWTPEQAEYDEL